MHDYCTSRRLERAPWRTRDPRSMNLTASSSLVLLSRISLATPKLPLPMSRIWRGVGRKSAVRRLQLAIRGYDQRVPRHRPTPLTNSNRSMI